VIFYRRSTQQTTSNKLRNSIGMSKKLIRCVTLLQKWSRRQKCFQKCQICSSSYGIPVPKLLVNRYTTQIQSYLNAMQSNKIILHRPQWNHGLTITNLALFLLISSQYPCLLSSIKKRTSTFKKDQVKRL